MSTGWFNAELRQYASRVPCICGLTAVYKMFQTLNLASRDIGCTERNRNKPTFKNIYKFISVYNDRSVIWVFRWASEFIFTYIHEGHKSAQILTKY